MGDSEVPGSWLQLGSVLAVSTIWEVNQQIEDLFSLFATLLSKINLSKTKKQPS